MESSNLLKRSSQIIHLIQQITFILFKNEADSITVKNESLSISTSTADMFAPEILKKDRKRNIVVSEIKIVMKDVPSVSFVPASNNNFSIKNLGIFKSLYKRCCKNYSLEVASIKEHSLQQEFLS